MGASAFLYRAQLARPRLHRLWRLPRHQVKAELSPDSRKPVLGLQVRVQLGVRDLVEHGRQARACDSFSCIAWTSFGSLSCLSNAICLGAYAADSSHPPRAGNRTSVLPRLTLVNLLHVRLSYMDSHRRQPASLNMFTTVAQSFETPTLSMIDAFDGICMTRPCITTADVCRI